MNSHSITVKPDAIVALSRVDNTVAGLTIDDNVTHLHLVLIDRDGDSTRKALAAALIADLIDTGDRTFVETAVHKAMAAQNRGAS